MTNGRRHSRRQRRPLRLPVDDGRKHVGGRLSDEWTAAAEHFVEHAPERPDVRTFVDRLPPGLLRTHVGGGPDNDLIAGLTVGTGGLNERSRVGRLVVRVERNLGLTDLRHAEVQYLDDAVRGDLDIGRLQVSMNDPFLVRGIQRIRDLHRDAKRLGHGQRSLGQPFRQRRPLNQFEHQTAHAIGLSDAVDRGDVRMIESGQQPRFLVEASPSIRIVKQLHVAGS